LIAYSKTASINRETGSDRPKKQIGVLVSLAPAPLEKWVWVVESMSQRPETLEDLADRARFELECLGYPTRTWVEPRTYNGTRVHDAVIVGGGQSGVAIAFRLLRERVTDIRVLDRNPKGLEGPWLTFARMTILRTPKTVTGPDLGVPSLTARAWYEARFGREAWDALDKIPRDIWQEYLLWLRGVTGIEVTNGAEAVDIEPLAEDLLAIHTINARGPETLFTQNAVLATGVEGCGRWTVPDMIRKALPKRCYAHTAEAIDFAALAGKRVAVVGAGASAFDNAACALENGAASIDLFARRKDMPIANPNRWMEFAGFLRHFGDLDDARKWRFMKTIFDMNQPPPQDTFERCIRFEQFALHLASPVKAARVEGDKLLLTTPNGMERFDFLIVGTGHAVDFPARPELCRFAPKIARWRDRYTPPPGLESDLLGEYPYLSQNFQFTERTPGEAPFLKNIFSYSFAAMPSLACSAGISALKFGVERVAYGITRNLFLADADRHLVALQNYTEPELDMSALRTRRPPPQTNSLEYSVVGQ
jgi:cation diffusion facilitator CzcD-associated flavoprotein CzcO